MMYNVSKDGVYGAPRMPFYTGKISTSATTSENQDGFLVRRTRLAQGIGNVSYSFLPQTVATIGKLFQSMVGEKRTEQFRVLLNSQNVSIVAFGN